MIYAWIYEPGDPLEMGTPVPLAIYVNNEAMTGQLSYAFFGYPLTIETCDIEMV